MAEDHGLNDEGKKGWLMDAVARLELKQELLREIDNLRNDMRDKADRKEVSDVAISLSQSQMDQSERNRALRDSVTEVERAVKGLAGLLSQESGGPQPSRFSLRGMDPRLLLAAGIVGGAAAGKSLELLIPIMLRGAS